MAYRVLSTISPELEQLIYKNNVDSVHIESLMQTIDFFSKMKNSTIFTIPKSLIGVLSSNKGFRIIKEKYKHDTQSNILFEDDSLINCKFQDYIPTLFPGFEYAISSTKYIIKNMYTRRLPLIFGSTFHDVNKKACNSCDKTTPCSPAYILKGLSPPTNYSEFNSLVLDAVGVSISHWHYNINNINEIDVKILITLMCILHKVSEEYFKIIKSINITAPFLRDINETKCDISNIVFSLFRACAYPSATGVKDRHPLSIDWHLNKPSKSGKYDLYRVDVLSPSRTGVRSSGLERILIGKTDGNFYAIFYTDSHDFPKKSIENRISEIEN